MIKLKVITIIFLLVISCNNEDEEKFKKDLLDAYSSNIKLLENEIIAEKMFVDFLIAEHKAYSETASMFEYGVELKKEFDLNYEEYLNRYEHFTSKANETQDKIPDTTFIIDSLKKQIKHFNQKIDSINNNLIDFKNEHNQIIHFQKKQKKTLINLRVGKIFSNSKK